MQEIICYCSHVTKAEIVASIRQGATTLEDIRTSTGACTLSQCATKSPTGKCCSPNIMKILEEETQNSSNT